MNNRLNKVAIAGLAAVVMALSTGCDEKPTPNYNPTVISETYTMPRECQEVVSAGVSSLQSIRYHWVSCYNKEGNLTIYRISGGNDAWQGITLTPHEALTNGNLQEAEVLGQEDYMTSSEGKVELQNTAQEQGDCNMSFCEYTAPTELITTQ